MVSPDFTRRMDAIAGLGQPSGLGCRFLDGWGVEGWTFDLIDEDGDDGRAVETGTYRVFHEGAQAGT